MKKKILGFTLAIGVALLAGCSQKNQQREVYVEVLNKCEAKFEKKSETKLTSSVSIDNFYLPSEDVSNYIDATRTFVHFLSLLYANENFKITDDAVCVNSDYVKDGVILQDNEIAILGNMDEENGFVNFELYGTCEGTNSTPGYLYMLLEINYDFKEGILKDFDMYMYNLKDDDLDKSSTSANRYVGGSLYYGYTDIEHCEVFYEYVSENYWTKHKDRLVNAEKIGDFSYEYTKATNDILGDNFFNQ